MCFDGIDNKDDDDDLEIMDPDGNDDKTGLFSIFCNKHFMIYLYISNIFIQSHANCFLLDVSLLIPFTQIQLLQN
jgi:hypothetical protein